MDDKAKKIENIFDKIGELTTEEKLNSIKKEEYFRSLYSEFFNLEQSKEFKNIAQSLIDGYSLLNSAYIDKPEIKKDAEYIIKFAFRDFYLLLFINLMSFFNENIFLKDLHKRVYFSNSYVTTDDFNELVDFCKNYIKENE